MSYPVQILPSLNRKQIDCDISEYYLIRFIEEAEINRIWDFETNTIVQQYLFSPKERIDDLSMSLLGIYTPEHVLLSFTESGSEKYFKYCNADANPEIPKDVLDFSLKPDRNYWCIPISKLHNLSFAYSSNQEPYSAICEVCHTPMLWNFWHFSLRWKTDQCDLKTLDDKKRRNISKRIGHAVRVTISQFASIQEPTYNVLPEKCYEK